MTGKKAIDNTATAEFRARAERRRRTWEGVTVHENFDDIKTAEYAWWSLQPTHAVMRTVAEMAAAAHGLKGIHVRRLRRSHRAPE